MDVPDNSPSDSDNLSSKNEGQGGFLPTHKSKELRHMRAEPVILRVLRVESDKGDNAGKTEIGKSGGDEKPAHLEKNEEVAKSQRKARTFFKSDDENHRLMRVAGLSSFSVVARIGNTDQLLFRCPVCSDQQQCDDSKIGNIHICDICGAELKIPDPMGRKPVEVMKSGNSIQPDTTGIAVHLPDEREGEEPGGKMNYKNLEEVLPDREDVFTFWGVEKKEIAENKKKSKGWLLVGVLFVLGSAAGVTKYTIDSTERLANNSLLMVDRTDDGPALNWERIPFSQAYEMAEKKVLAYLNASTVKELSQHVRGGEKKLAAMLEFYERTGGFEPATVTHGAIADVNSLEKRTIGNVDFMMTRVKFANNVQGIFALYPGKSGYEVDWEYAVGYGRMGVEQLVEAKPEKPVLLRVYLKKSPFLADGFKESEYGCFELTDSQRNMIANLYVKRSSIAFRKLTDAWREYTVTTFGSTENIIEELDFVLRVRYEKTDGRSGFVLDEYVSRGWILEKDIE